MSDTCQIPVYHRLIHALQGEKDIQEATASEPLTLEEEYRMQQSWRKDPDKLTFISCLPLSGSSSGCINPTPAGNGDDDETATIQQQQMQHDGPDRMLGDVNLFLKLQERDDEDEMEAGKLGAEGSGEADREGEDPFVVGEIELMVAEKCRQRKGFGRASLLCFLKYFVDHEVEILGEFIRGEGAATIATTGTGTATRVCKFGYLVVRIGATNLRSLALFESLGFVRVRDKPNVFGELELRRYGLSAGVVDKLLYQYKVDGYREIEYV